MVEFQLINVVSSFLDHTANNQVIPLLRLNYKIVFEFLWSKFVENQPTYHDKDEGVHGGQMMPQETEISDMLVVHTNQQTVWKTSDIKTMKTWCINGVLLPPTHREYDAQSGK